MAIRESANIIILVAIKYECTFFIGDVTCNFMRHNHYKYFLVILSLIAISSFQNQNDKLVTIKDGFYKFPSVARVTMFYQVKGKKISFYRTHAGHYAAFGKYTIELKDSTLLIEYDKTIASHQFKDIEPFEGDTIGFTINSKNEIDLFGLTYIEPESGEFYKNMSRIIKRDSKMVKPNN